MSDQNTLADLHEASGKVREMYGFGDQMLMVASDRMSAFDVVLPTPIPDKGRVLTGDVAVLVRAVQGDRPKPPDLRRAQGLPDPGTE